MFIERYLDSQKHFASHWKFPIAGLRHYAVPQMAFLAQIYKTKIFKIKSENIE